jgi:cytochrome c oxidase cbb3-type subunit 2
VQSEPSSANHDRPSIFQGWAGIVLIAATYVYFLIFAQFGFLKRLAALGITQSVLPGVMGAMAVGGIAMSLLAPRSRLWNCPSCRLQTGLIGCALAALWSLFPLNAFTAGGVALVIGLSLGLLTVTLVSDLPLWTGPHRPMLKIALGTGLGYFLCNFPPLFNASPATIAIVSAICCILAIVVANRARLLYIEAPPDPASNTREIPFVFVLAWFTALVWLDSAAFYIIQNSPSLKAGAWQGSIHLWRTGVLHLVAALGSAWLLARRGLVLTLALALAALGGACVLLLNPYRASMASFLYPFGVSLYSVALVAYPSFLMGSSPGSPRTGLRPWGGSLDHAARARRAGYLYAAAGWVGSALGIGMGHDLHHIPPAFVALAAALFLLPWLWHAVETGHLGGSAQIQVLAVIGVLAVAFAITLVVRPTIRPFANIPADNPIDRGRRVYISEGCINCHSQYVRPHTADVAMWGPASDLDAVRRQRPPLIGNRRQGPDLSEVGARRSSLWLRIHFLRPRDVSYASPMPSYDYLFRSTRGDDLVAYLSSLNDPRHWNEVDQWQPAPASWEQAARLDGAELFDRHCATCHAPDGFARRKWSSSFRRRPPDLARDPLEHVSSSAIPAGIARITRFGIQGTDMPGHEYLPDDQVAAIAAYVARQRAAAHRDKPTNYPIARN